MPQTVEVRFKGSRRAFYSWAHDSDPLQRDEPVVVAAERGFDLGWVHSAGAQADQKCGGCSGRSPGTEEAEAAPYPAITRRALAGEVSQQQAHRADEDEVRREVSQRADSHGLQMRISDAEWQWDRQRLTVYFTADRRVDFRALVRELASRYRTRIELRQIGVREEAARLGGIGRCGREFCCTTWLDQPGPVNLGLAKDQRLSLNPAQISGGCGRLLCCLKYEHQFYLESRRRFPKEGRTVETLIGTETVTAVDIFRELVSLGNAEHGNRTIALVTLQSEMTQASARAGGATQ